MCGAIVVAFGILTVSQVLVAQAREARESAAIRGAVGNEIVTIQSRQPGPDSGGFIAAAGPDRTLQVFAASPGNGMVVGSCAALRSLGQFAACPAGTVAVKEAITAESVIGHALRLGYGSVLVGGADLAMSTRPPDGGRLLGFLVINRDGSTGFENIARLAFRVLAMPEISTSGLFWIAGTVALADAYSWLSLFGTVGVVVLILTSMLGALDVFIGQAQGLGPLGSMVAGRRVYAAISLWNVAVPLVVASAVGALVAAFLGFLFTKLRASGSVSVPLLVGCVAVTAVMSLFMAAVSAEIAVRTVRRWRPVVD
jgi:hypothetical protein